MKMNTWLLAFCDVLQVKSNQQLAMFIIFVLSVFFCSFC